METVEEYNHAKKQLMGLDKSVLVNALLQLALELNSVSLLVNGLIATKEERLVLFKSYIEKVTLQEDILTGEQILEILTRSLDLLDPVSMDPKIALQLLEIFYSTDSLAFESTTELDFEFDCLYSKQAYNLFCSFAQQCDDKMYVQQIVDKLLSSDGYGVRTNLNQIILS
jgi:hypothetical protein